MHYTTVYGKSFTKPVAFSLVKLTTFIFTIGTLIAMILYPGYNIGDRYLSELGTHHQSSIWFNLSVMLSSLLLIPVFIGLFTYLRPKVDGVVEFILGFSLFTSFLSSIFLFMVGLFPAANSTLYIHNLVAMIFFILLGVTFWLLTIILLSLKSEDQFSDKKVEDYLGLIFLPLVVLFADLTLWYSQLLQKAIVYIGLFYLSYLMERFIQLNKEKTVYYHHERFEKTEAYSLDQVLVHNRIGF